MFEQKVSVKPMKNKLEFLAFLFIFLNADAQAYTRKGCTPV